MWGKWMSNLWLIWDAALSNAERFAYNSVVCLVNQVAVLLIFPAFLQWRMNYCGQGSHISYVTSLLVKTNA